QRNRDEAGRGGHAPRHEARRHDPEGAAMALPRAPFGRRDVERTYAPHVADARQPRPHVHAIIVSRPMIPVIGLDARMAGPTPSGLGTYATALARALAARDAGFTYVVIRTPQSPGPIVDGPNVRDVVLPSPLDTPGNLLRGADLSRLGLDPYHSLHHFLPPGLRVPRVVVTLHDLIWIEHRRLIVDGRFGALNRTVTHLYARGAMRYALRRADRIVAVSAHSARRAIARYQLDPSRVAVVRHGVDRTAFTA